jgi:hypothetical protein
MARPVAYNLVQKPLEADISMAEMPEGSMAKVFLLLR